MPVSPQTAKDSIAVLSTTASTVVTVGTSSAVAGLLTSAGVTASAVPVVGWVVGGVLAATAGTIALVGAVRRGKMRKAEAISAAKAAGIPDAEEVPAFLVQAMKAGPAWRGKQTDKIVKRVMKDQKKGNTGKSAQKDLSRLKLLAVLDLHERAALRGNEPPAVAPEAAARAVEVTPAEIAAAPAEAGLSDDYLYLAAAGVGLAGLGLLAWRFRG